jgi:hypothetical protein
MRARTVRSSNAWRCAASGLLALAAALVPRAARADDAQQFELLKGLFYAGQYEDVVKRTTILLDTSNPACATVEGAPTVPQTCHLADGVLIERSREMQVVALVAVKRQADADAIMEKMLRQNPAYSPEPGSLPPAVVERLREIKARLQKELEDDSRKRADEQRKARMLAQKASEEERKWLAELTALASKETVIERRSRLIAFVPFGVGQLQNGDTALGFAFMAAQALAAGSAITFGTVHAFYASVDPGTKDANGDPVDKDALGEWVRISALGNQVSFGVLGALAIAGIVQANIAFVPEVRTTRDRPVPKRPAPVVVPTVVASGQGVSVGLVGSF